MVAQWNRERTREARRQLIGFVLICGVAAGSALLAAHRPADASKLRSVVGPLRSDASAAALLLEQRANVPERFATAQAAELAHRTDDAQKSLADLSVEPDLDDAWKEANALAARLRTQLDLYPAHATDARAIAGIAKELKRIDESLRR